jgi:hypothetical protein
MAEALTRAGVAWCVNEREALWAWSVQLAFLRVVTADADVPEDGGVKVRSKCGSLPTELHVVTHKTTVKSGFDSRQGRQEYPF